MLEPALSPTAREALCADVLPAAFAIVSLAVALVGLAMLAAPRWRDLRLVGVVLCTGLYGARLLATTHAAELIFGVPSSSSAALRAVVSYIIPIPFVLLCAALLSGWRRTLQVIAAVLGAFAAVAIPWEWAARSPGALSRPSSLLVLATFALVLALVFRPTATPSWELRRLRLSFLVATIFIVCENLRGLGVLPWPEGIEPLGLLLFLIGLGTLVAHRILAGESRLAEVRRGLETARRIQTSILPRELPRIDGLEVAVRYLPAEDVAGDFYDFTPAAGRRVGVLVADVSGHGVPAALIASMIKVAVAAQAEHAESPAKVLSGMNRIFHGKLRDHFITAAYVFVDLEAARVTWANAGHPPPLLASGGAVRELEPTGVVLGRLSRADYTERSLPLAGGDRLVLFTDGIPECPSPAGELYGDARLQALAAERPGLPPEPFAAALVERLSRWSGTAAERGLADDLTLVVLQLAG